MFDKDNLQLYIYKFIDLRSYTAIHRMKDLRKNKIQKTLLPSTF